jgi:hypothetical protein
MAVVANVTEVSNSVTIGNVLSSVSSPAFVKAAVGLNSLYREDLPGKGQSAVKKFVKDGSLTVTNPQAESDNLAIGAGGEYTETSVSATAAKCAIVSGLSLEADKFGNVDMPKLIAKAGEAVGRAVSNDLIGMGAGFSNGVTCTAVATLADLYTAQFTIFNANCPNQEVLPHFICNPRAGRAIKSELSTTGASAFVNPQMLEVLMGLPSTGGYLGQIPGLCEVYQTTGFAATGGDDQQPFMHPMWALAGIFDGAPDTWITKKGSEGFYTEAATSYFYDIVEWNDAAGVNFRSDT